MRSVLFVALFLSALKVFACSTPTSKELARFFENSKQWTEVENETSLKIALKRPVFLRIGFEKKSATSIVWGDNNIAGKDISICWYSPDKKHIRISKGFFRVTLIKVKPGLIKSWIPFDGDLFYRKDNEVIRLKKPRTLAKEKEAQ